jgi:hypothetical protein
MTGKLSRPVLQAGRFGDKPAQPSDDDPPSMGAMTRAARLAVEPMVLPFMR